MSAVAALSQWVPMTRACAALGLARSTVYRSRRPVRRKIGAPEVKRRYRSLSVVEREHVRATLNDPKYVDLAPRTVFARLLDKGVYLCHWRTMYRVLAEHGEIRERRAQRPPQSHVRPELVATGPNQIWTWDITKLKGKAKGQYFFLYVILDIFSRYVVGWMAEFREGEDLARQLVAATAAKEHIIPGSLTLHADRGSPMTAAGMAELLQSLGIAKSHSRPRVSNDNPYSESNFKTIKYRPLYPGRFRDFEHVRTWGGSTFQWYNHEHQHSGLCLLTPAEVHSGRAPMVLAGRQNALDQAYLAHPERFPAGQPFAGELATAVYINAPALDLHAEPSSNAELVDLQ